MGEKRILIIDDAPLMRHLLAGYLSKEGYSPVTAADGVAGLAHARSQPFQAVLVDLRMPQMDGFEVIATLRAEQPELPVVVVSGASTQQDVIEAMRRGAWDYIIKPVQDMDQIAVVIERVLDKARLTAERNRYEQALQQANHLLETELAALNRVSYAISGPLDLDTMLNRAVDAAIAAVEADGGVVRLLNPSTQQLVVAAARGVPRSYLATATAIPIGEGVVGRVAQSGHPQAGHDFDDPWMAALAAAGGGFGAYLCVPLRAGEAGQKHPIVGTLCIVTHAERRFGAHTVELLAAIGNQIGVAVARAQYAVELEQANLQLERANADLRRLDMLREQFIQNVAHELRTPLALVHGYIAMLAEGNLTPEEQAKSLAVASRHVKTLVNLVEAVTTLQDLSSQPLRIGRVAPAEVMQTACKMVAQRAAACAITVESVCPPDIATLLGDFTRLAQALHQLLDNACKFSPKGSTVMLAAQLSDDGNAVHFSVADHGIGIAPEQHARIFETFYQVDGSTTRRYGGTGLGLALVKEIVEAHKGTVTVQSALGAGSTFTLTVPIRPG